MILGGENEAVFELFQDGVLEILSCRSGKVKKEESLLGVDSVGDIVPFSDRENLDVRGVIGIELANEPGLSGVSNGVNHEKDLTVIGLRFEKNGEVTLIGSILSFNSNRRGVYEVDPLHASSIGQPDRLPLEGNFGGGRLGRMSENPFFESCETVGRALGCGKRSEFLKVIFLLTIIGGLLVRALCNFEVRISGKQTTDPSKAETLLKDDKALEMGSP